MDYENLVADVTMIVPVHYTSGRGGKNIEFVGIHYNAADFTVEECYNTWLTRVASAHYQVESGGRTGQLVWDGDTGWSLNDFDANQRSINLEHANLPDGTITEACLDAGAHLVAAICKYYGLGRPEWDVNVFPHKHFSATSCPGQIYGSQKDAYIQRAQMWYDKMINPEPAPEPVIPLPDALKKFTDLVPGEWYIGSLDKAVQLGYIHGYSDTIMAPNNYITRGQATVIIANAADATFEHPYEDVDADPYYYDSVAWAKDEGIIADADIFRPNDNCSREEFICMLCNWKGSPSSNEHTEFSDWNNVSAFAKGAVSWAIENGIIGGNNGMIRPTDGCTRAEAVAMLVNLTS